MTTWREARDAKTERLRREARYYTPDMLGRPCRYCGHKMPIRLLYAGENTHATCGPNGLR